MAKADRGTKRQCQSCATKFYDLNREPVLCPSCGAEFKVVVAAPAVAPLAKKAPIAEVAKTDEVETDVAAVAAGAEVISLDDIDVDDDDDDDDDDVIDNIPDVDLDDDDDDTVTSEDDNTFLETDDDDDEIGFDVPVKKNEDI